MILKCRIDLFKVECLRFFFEQSLKKENFISLRNELAKLTPKRTLSAKDFFVMQKLANTLSFFWSIGFGYYVIKFRKKLYAKT